MFNIRHDRFLKIVATEPLIFQRLYRNGGKMFFLIYVLVHNGGPVSMMVDINFGATAYAAYFMISSVVTARVIELFVCTQCSRQASRGVLGPTTTSTAVAF